jgi:hypothetical protein
MKIYIARVAVYWLVIVRTYKFHFPCFSLLLLLLLQPLPPPPLP